MHLSWLGLSAFKIEAKDATLVTDPYGPKAAKKPLRAKADIVTISRFADPSHGHVDAIQGSPFVIDHPGEYELKGIFAQGMAVPQKDGVKSSTVFSLDVEGMRLVHLGGLETMPSPELLEKIDGVDILLLPAGGMGLELKQAVKLVNDIEPRVVVPMHFSPDGIKIFLKEMGASGVKPVDKQIFKKKDLPDAEDTRVVLFSN